MIVLIDNVLGEGVFSRCPGTLMQLILIPFSFVTIIEDSVVDLLHLSIGGNLANSIFLEMY